jgi:carbamoyltransferase
VIYLGISEDLFDAGVTLVNGDAIVFASNEERYTRRKNEGGFPHQSLQALLEYTRVDLADIDHVCVCGHMTPPLPVRVFPFLHTLLFDAHRSREETLFKKFVDLVMFHSPVARTSERSFSRRFARRLLPTVMRRALPAGLRRIPIHFAEHHRAHAAGAWFCSGFEEALCLTADGMGDGLSMTVSHAVAGKAIERLWTAPAGSSFGLFFEALAQAFGFTPCRDEGKITGLAATGKAENVREPSPFTLVNGMLTYTGPVGRKGVAWVRDHLVARYGRADVSAWGQELLEKYTLNVARDWLRSTGLRNLVVAGGVFANVKLNQHLHELEEVDQLFVYPNMGDGGLSLGAICETRGFYFPKPIQHVFLGEAYTDEQIAATLNKAGLSFEYLPDPERTAAQLLAKDLIVGRFCGAMEWGPRALGNRSILVRAVDPKITGRLNKMLTRSDFMPFAPALPAEDAELYCHGVEAARHTAEFMTVCFRCTERMQTEHAPVVHVDGTARAQLVTRENNPTFHRILMELKTLVGSGVVLNTSFNIHEEPIIRTPEHAVNAFLAAGLDALIIGSYLVKQPRSGRV